MLTLNKYTGKTGLTQDPKYWYSGDSLFKIHSDVSNVERGKKNLRRIESHSLRNDKVYLRNRQAYFASCQSLC